MKRLKILFLEPFYGGSHKNFADNLASRSSHDIRLETLPARFWKWRMRGAALYFAEKIKNPEKYDLVLTSGLMSFSDLKSLWGTKCPPGIVYFHETQLNYPLGPGEKMDLQYGFTDITSAMGADRVLFNSHFHKQSFLMRLPDFIGKMPDFKPLWVTAAIDKKSSVIYPGCDFSHITNNTKKTEGPPVIVWNHRWEHDKNPGDFFKLIDEMINRGLNFRLSLLGESFKDIPEEFKEAEKKYKKQLLRYGYAPSRKEYGKYLYEGDIIISTANQENFGISVVEAVRAGCRPLLPSRLSYPEIIPEKFHDLCLYTGNPEEKLAELLTCRETVLQELTNFMKKYAWENMIREYDAFFSGMV